MDFKFKKTEGEVVRPNFTIPLNMPFTILSILLALKFAGLTQHGYSEIIWFSVKVGLVCVGICAVVGLFAFIVWMLLLAFATKRRW